jgi:proliferating cell nuclear antigen
MFKTELSNPTILKLIFDTVSSIVDEVIIKVDNDGLRLNALDRGHFTYINLNLRPDLFDEYVCDEPETIGVDSYELLKVLKLAKKDDRVILSVEDYALIIILEGESRSRFKIKLIDVDEESPDPPTLEFPVTFSLDVSVLKDTLKKVEAFDTSTNNKIIFEVDKDYFYAYSDNEMVDIDIKFLHGENVESNHKSVFTIDKVKNILRAEKLSEYITIRLGDDMPMSMSYDLLDAEFSFLLAPRIESE